MASATIFRPGATALITGGASGVGFAMATIFRQHGMHLAILDRSKDHLSAAVAALKTQAPSLANHPGIKTEGYELDVSDLDAWQALKPQIVSTFGPKIDVLMLNAGTSVKPTTAQSYLDVAYFHKTLETNLFGVVNGLATFLPAVQEASSADNQPSAVIITGSKQGITNPPGAANPAYNMSKSAIKTLAEHLAHDLRTPESPSYSPHTSVHLLIPGWTFTGLSGNAGPVSEDKKKPNGAWWPSQCAEYGAHKIREGKFYIVCPDDDVDEALDQARMAYAVGDVVEGRAALSRWDVYFKDEAARWIGEEADRRRGKEKAR